MAAYAAVIYLVIRSDTSCSVKFVAARTRVSPISRQTIPRLELLSALLLARLMTSVSQSLESELHLDTPICFTDSKIVLFWIQGLSKEWKQFVQHCINEIRRLLPIDVWRQCPGKDNPAAYPWTHSHRPISQCIMVPWS